MHKININLFSYYFNNFKIIDYSILNPTKQIWINLELYFESYEFYNF